MTLNGIVKQIVEHACEAKITEMSVCTGVEAEINRWAGQGQAGWRHRSPWLWFLLPALFFPGGQEAGCDGKKEQSPRERAGSHKGTERLLLSAAAEVSGIYGWRADGRVPPGILSPRMT